MHPLKATLQQAVSGMQLQSKRLGLTAENISNADTPGYQRKLLVLEGASDASAAFKAARIALDQTEGERSYDPAHPLADESGYVTLSNVALVTELADMREANRSYEANLNSFQQARTMFRSMLDLMRR